MSAAQGPEQGVRAWPGLSDEDALATLHESLIEPVGVLTQASNLTLLVDLRPAADGGAPGGGSSGPAGHRAVYKPVRGEQPLRDFPDGTLAAREVAAYLVSRAGGFDIVPPTLLRDGPLGPGSVQWWVDQEPGRLADPSGGLVEVLPPEQVDAGWLPVVLAEDEDGNDVVVAHADDPQLRRMCMLDVLLNNADRKAAHLTLDPAGRLRGFDHGLSLHADDKLRTVLWGWVGDPLREDELVMVHGVLAALDGDLAGELEAMLLPHEVEGLRRRARSLVDAGIFPSPPGDRYPLPWPLW